MAFQIAGLSGSRAIPSKTRALVDLTLTKLTARFDVTTRSFDLADFLPSLGIAEQATDLEPLALTKLQAILSADALVIGSPIYKGSYPGLLKHLFDLIDPEALRGKPILLLAAGGGDRHALVIEHQLRPLMGFFEAAPLPTGVYASARDFTDGQPSSPALLSRLDRAVAKFAPIFASHDRLAQVA